MDHFTVYGFRDRRRPVLSAKRKFVDDVRRELGFSDEALATVLKGRDGVRVADLRDLDGVGFLNLMLYFETVGFDMRRIKGTTLSARQVRMLQVARKQLGLPDERYYAVLQLLGGVNSAGDLDQRGFDLVMAFMEAEGFNRAPVRPPSRASGAGRAWGRRSRSS